ncbi:lipopolysaccharide/colanic/teichoic acid biosynthesis glycosyltransferase [Sinorhizobium fredii]|uniref:Putative sugar transferase EpsL n=1 Tax=Sinorhizobium fredii (strain USDA 257) TaxID=1185652 RepID=I3X7E4_SINF2|nr:sugar transferase [Sinorhizobium fredii]AFL51800.1 putative sugar transferase EpsL [Sinorhizobium fredii USDA 257]
MKPNREHAVFAFGLPASSGSYRLKRVLECALGGMLLVLCLPLMAVTAIVVWVSLGSPLFFTQSRAGSGMRVFTVAKFRTMTDARGPDGALLQDQMRQTAATSLLRRLRFDELPQLLSVLAGDMSIVGPRPLPLATVVSFGDLGRLRSLVAPGMTGWAQVNGNTLLSDEEKIALDLWYVAHASAWLDVRILLLTLKTIVLGERVNEVHLKIAKDFLLRHSCGQQPRGKMR